MSRAWLSLAALVLSIPASAETLADAARIALANNPRLAAARARQDALGETPEQARALGRLTADAEASTGYDRLGYGGEATGTIGATLPIWTGERVRSAVRAADADVAAGDEAVRDVAAAVLTEVVQTYADVLFQRQALEIAKADIALLDSQVSEAKARFDLGVGTETDVSRLVAQRASAQSSEAAAEAALASAAASYRAVVGRPPGVLAVPPETLALLPATIDAARAAALSANPPYRQSLAAHDAANARIDVARANGAPSIQAIGGYGYGVGSRSGGDGSLRAAAAGLSLRVPLLTGGLVSSQVREARAYARAARYDIDAAGRDAVRAAETAWANVVAAKSRVAANAAAATAAERALAGVKAEYAVGLRTTLDILIADESLRAAQLALASSRSDLLTGETALLRATGALREQAFGPDTAA